MNVRFYRSALGRSPVEAFIDALPDAEQAVLYAMVRRLKAEGLDAPVVLLHAYRKQSQKAPKSEVETARRRANEVLAQEQGP